MTTRVTVEICGTSRTVQVSEEAGRLRMALDGQELSIDAVQVAPGRWSLLIGAARASRDVRVCHDQTGSWTVFVEGTRVPVIVRDPSRHRDAAGAGDEASGPARIVAPMPGKIVRLLVASGEPVTARQGVAVVEAMKMENELKAPRAGTVLDVFVREGASVEAGAPLMVIG